MKKSPLRLVLSLSALLGAALLLPQGAAAHDRESHSRVDRHHYQPDHLQDPQRHYRAGEISEWHLLRHRELRHSGYRPQKRHYRIKGKQHAHRHHHHYVERQQQRVQRHTQTQPVQLELSYHIVL